MHETDRRPNDYPRTLQASHWTGDLRRSEGKGDPAPYVVRLDVGGGAVLMTSSHPPAPAPGDDASNETSGSQLPLGLGWIGRPSISEARQVFRERIATRRDWALADDLPWPVASADRACYPPAREYAVPCRQKRSVSRCHVRCCPGTRHVVATLDATHRGRYCDENKCDGKTQYNIAWRCPSNRGANRSPGRCDGC